MVTDSINDRTERNRVAAARLAATRLIAPVTLAVAFVVVATFFVSWFITVPIALIAVTLAAWDTRRRVGGATAAVGTVAGGDLADEAKYPRLYNLVEAMTVSAGVEAPELRIVDDESVNLLVAGAPDEAILVVTSGLLGVLDRVELEGVLAHGLARIRCYDAFLGAQAAVLLGGPLLRRGPDRSGGSTSNGGRLAEWRIRGIREAFGADHDVLCDFAAVDVTRYPPGLAAAYRKMAERGCAVRGATWGTAHLWLADPFAGQEFTNDTTASRLGELVARPELLAMRTDLMEEL